MIKKMSTVCVEYGVIPDEFELNFKYNGELETAETYYSEYESTDSDIRKATRRKIKDRIRRLKWNVPDIKVETKTEDGKITLHIEGSRKYVIWGMLQEILLQAKSVMSDEEIEYLVEETQFLDEESDQP